jgi:hypothetical protein
VSTFGGARATIDGNLLSGQRKGPWWIPADHYAIRYGASEEANITPQLTQIREAILAETYNKNKSTPKCSIQDAHQQITQAISPYRKSKCSALWMHQERLQMYQRMPLQQKFFCKPK